MDTIEKIDLSKYTEELEKLFEQEGIGGEEDMEEEKDIFGVTAEFNTKNASYKLWSKRLSMEDAIEDQKFMESYIVKLGDQLPSTKMTTQDVLDYGQAHGIVVKCPYCKSSTWDNRTSKTNSKSPDFRCKSKACGAAAWERETGQLKWVPGGEKK